MFIKKYYIKYIESRIKIRKEGEYNSVVDSTGLGMLVVVVYLIEPTVLFNASWHNKYARNAHCSTYKARRIGMLSHEERRQIGQA